MGPAAVVPLAFGAGVAGVTYWMQRQRLADARACTRQVLADGELRWNGLWRRWLDGALARPARDLEIDLLIENMALLLVEREQP
jgi:hypothetical protein